MKFQKEFREEYFAKIKSNGYELNWQMFVEMEKDLYIEWLETKLKNIPQSPVCSNLNEEIKPIKENK